MTSCSGVEEDIGKENGKQENSPTEMDKTMDALEAMPMHLSLGQIFS